MLKAMEELDSGEQMPDGLDPAVWERFCNSRRAKVECEHQVCFCLCAITYVCVFVWLFS